MVEARKTTNAADNERFLVAGLLRDNLALWEPLIPIYQGSQTDLEKSITEVSGVIATNEHDIAILRSANDFINTQVP